MCVSAVPKSQGTEVYTFNNYPNKLTLYDICETKLIGINELHIWRKLGRILFSSNKSQKNLTTARRAVIRSSDVMTMSTRQVLACACYPLKR